VQLVGQLNRELTALEGEFPSIEITTSRARANVMQCLIIGFYI